MSSETTELSDLAGAVADGVAVDWEALDIAARTPEERRRIRHLRVLARLATVYRETPDEELPLGPDASAAWPGNAAYLPLQRGAKWGGLEIIERLGSGSFGEVYRARDPRLDREVALKLLHARASRSDASAQSEIVEEGRLLARVRHPNVVAVFGADRIDGRVGIWMELVEGCTLEDEAREHGPMSAEPTLHIGIALGRALSAVHAAGLLHRDIKPQNVMRDLLDGRIVLMDFSAGREAMVESHGLPVSVAGSPIYIAPEILEGQPATARSDVYSLGVLLYRLASGSFPVTGSSLVEVRDAHRSGARTALAARRPDLARAFVQVVDRATSANPADRFESGEAVATALASLLGQVAGKHDKTRHYWWHVPAALTIMVALSFWAWNRGRVDRATPGGLIHRAPVLVGDFRADSGDAVLEKTLAVAVANALNATDRAAAVPPATVHRLLRLMRQPEDRRLDARIAREIAQRSGSIRAIVTGRMSGSPREGHVTLDVTSPNDGALVASISEAVNDDGPGAAIERGAAALAAKVQSLLPLIPEVSRPSEQVTTTSWQALQLYSRAAMLMNDEGTAPDAGEHGAADLLLREAVSLDPSFASAWLLLARTALAQHPFTTEYRPMMTNAIDVADGVSDLERYRILGWWHLRLNDETGSLAELEAAVQMYERVLAADPGDDAALQSLRGAYEMLGRQDDADNAALRAAAKQPASLRLALTVSQVEMRRGRLDASRRLATRALAAAQSDANDERGFAGGGATPALVAAAADLRQPPDSDLAWARLWDAHAAWLADNPTEALAMADQASLRWHAEGERARTEWGWHLSSVYLGLGQFRKAEAAIRRLWRSEFRDRDLAALAVRRGDLGQARALLEDARSFEQATHAATLLVWAGFADRADWVAEQRRARGFGPRWRQRAVDEGVLRVAQGRYAEARALLEPLVPSAALGRGIYLTALENLAVARRQLGDRSGAIELLEPLEHTRSYVVSDGWDVYAWLTCRVLLAELYAEAGRRTDAERVSRQVRTLLAISEPGHPLLTRLVLHCRC